jgi:P27 family predicted phage terminase small subunit
MLGNPGKRAIRQTLVAPASATPRPPRAQLEEKGKEMWAKVWQHGWLTPADQPIVVMLCQAADERAKLREELEATPRWYQNKNGQIVSHPAVSQLRELEKQVTQWLSLLGFTPTDRARLGVAEAQTISKLDELNSRRRSGSSRSVESTN